MVADRIVALLRSFHRRAARRVLGAGAIALVVAACGSSALPGHEAAKALAPLAVSVRSSLESVPLASLCVTQGRLVSGADGRSIGLHDSVFRAVIAGDRSHSAELVFRYEGPSVFATPLASGELRRQIGLKLRAQDTCNVVYVMWHLEPTPKIAVSVKHNPGASTHRECGDRGYDNVRPETSTRPPPIERGARHVLRAELEGGDLRVTADAVVVWTGRLPAAAATFDGPAGLRTDNGAFEVELRVPGGSRAPAACP